jgi:arsenical pump membrane protein
MAVSPIIGIEMWIVSLVAATGLFCYDAAVAMFEHSNKNLSFYRVFKRYVYRSHTKVYSFRLHLIAERMPWKIMPFLICAFIMVEGLVVSGVTDGIASFLSLVSVNVFASALSMGLLSSFSANLINNQPMTVLFTKITESQNFLLTGSDRIASVYALIAGSNLGANITLIGALAGIMWANILKHKDKGISYKNFAKLGLIVTVPVIIATCMMLALELFLFG